MSPGDICGAACGGICGAACGGIRGGVWQRAAVCGGARPRVAAGGGGVRAGVGAAAG